MSEYLVLLLDPMSYNQSCNIQQFENNLLIGIKDTQLRSFLKADGFY